MIPTPTPTNPIVAVLLLAHPLLPPNLSPLKTSCQELAKENPQYGLTPRTLISKSRWRTIIVCGNSALRQARIMSLGKRMRINYDKSEFYLALLDAVEYLCFSHELYSAPRYEQINPIPEWATNARDKLHSGPPKRRRSSSSSSQDDSPRDLDDLLSSTSGLLQKSRKSQLPQGELSIERLRDANHAGVAEGSITCVKFHPSAAAPVMMTTSQDRRMRLFNVRFPFPSSSVDLLF